MTEWTARGEAAGATGGSWQASELIRRPVVDVRLGHHLGDVGDIVFDPAARRIAGLLVQGRGRKPAVLQAARRAFGGTSGLTFMDVERIISLHADVVTVLAEAETDGRPRAGNPIPRLSAYLDFAVISIQGRRLGRFADLLLAPNGRSIVGYLMRPPEGAAHGVVDAEAGAAAQHVSQPAAPAVAPEGAEAAPHDTAASPAPALLMIPADQDVRFGRDLIVVAGRHDAAPLESPVVEPRSAAPESDDIADAPTWNRWQSEAPTEQVHH